MRFPPAKWVVVILLLAPTAWPGNRQAPADANQEWTKAHFPDAFEDFFPTRQAEGDFIAVRAHQEGSHETPEFSFLIENTQDPKTIRAALYQAQGLSLYRQLGDLHRRDPSKSYADLKPELKIETWKFPAAECPAVKAQYDAFENIQFVRPRDEDSPGENPIVYEINETVAGGSSEVIEFMPNRALPRWAEATRQALLACRPSTQGGHSGNEQKAR
jgi:hypothetical protein